MSIPFEEIELHGSPGHPDGRGARGEGGYFRPEQGAVWFTPGPDPIVSFLIEPRLNTGDPPIRVDLSPNDMLALADALHRASARAKLSEIKERAR